MVQGAMTVQRHGMVLSPRSRDAALLAEKKLREQQHLEHELDELNSRMMLQSNRSEDSSVFSGLSAPSKSFPDDGDNYERLSAFKLSTEYNDIISSAPSSPNKPCGNNAQYARSIVTASSNGDKSNNSQVTGVVSVEEEEERDHFRTLPGLADEDTAFGLESPRGGAEHSRGMPPGGRRQLPSQHMHEDELRDDDDDASPTTRSIPSKTIDAGQYMSNPSNKIDADQHLSSISHSPHDQKVETSESEDRITAMLQAHERMLNMSLDIIDEEDHGSTTLSHQENLHHYDQKRQHYESQEEHQHRDTGQDDGSNDGQFASTPRRARSLDEERPQFTPQQSKQMQIVLHQAREEVESLRDNNEQFMSEIEQTEEEHESEMKLFENRTRRKLTELKSMYAIEMDLLIKEKDAAIVESGKQAVLYTERSRQQIQLLKTQLRMYQQRNEVAMDSAVQEAIRSTTESVSMSKDQEHVEQLNAYQKHYEEKLRIMRADHRAKLKSGIQKAVETTTQRLRSDLEKEMAQTVPLLRERLEREKNSALHSGSKQRLALNKALDASREKCESQSADLESMKITLELTKRKLMKFHGKRVENLWVEQKTAVGESAVRTGSKYMVQRGADVPSSEAEALLNELLETHAFLLESAEVDVMLASTKGENRWQAEREESMSQQKKLKAKIEELQSSHQDEVDYLKTKHDTTLQELSRMEDSLKKAKTEKQEMEQKHAIELTELREDSRFRTESSKDSGGDAKVKVMLEGHQKEIQQWRQQNDDTRNYIRKLENSIEELKQEKIDLEKQRKNSDSHPTDSSRASMERISPADRQQSGARKQVTEPEFVDECSMSSGQVNDPIILTIEDERDSHEPSPSGSRERVQAEVDGAESWRNRKLNSPPKQQQQPIKKNDGGSPRKSDTERSLRRHRWRSHQDKNSPQHSHSKFSRLREKKFVRAYRISTGSANSSGGTQNNQNDQKPIVEVPTSTKHSNSDDATPSTKHTDNENATNLEVLDVAETIDVTDLSQVASSDSHESTVSAKSNCSRESNRSSASKNSRSSVRSTKSHRSVMTTMTTTQESDAGGFNAEELASAKVLANSMQSGKTSRQAPGKIEKAPQQLTTSREQAPIEEPLNNAPKERAVESTGQVLKSLLPAGLAGLMGPKRKMGDQYKSNRSTLQVISAIDDTDTNAHDIVQEVSPGVNHMRAFFEGIAAENSPPHRKPLDRASLDSASLSSLKAESGVMSPRSKMALARSQSEGQGPSQVPEDEAAEDTSNDPEEVQQPISKKVSPPEVRKPSFGLFSHRQKQEDEHVSNLSAGDGLRDGNAGVDKDNDIRQPASSDSDDHDLDDLDLDDPDIQPKVSRDGPTWTIKLKKTWPPPTTYEKSSRSTDDTTNDQTSRTIDEEISEEKEVGNENLLLPELRHAASDMPVFPRPRDDIIASEHDIRPAAGIHVINGKKPPLRNRSMGDVLTNSSSSFPSPIEDEVSESRSETGVGKSAEISTSVQTAKKIFIGRHGQRNASTGNSLSRFKQQQQTIEEEEEESRDDDVFDPLEIQPTAAVAPSTSHLDIFATQSELRERDGYPSLGDESDEELCHEDEESDDDDGEPDRYATFEPVQFSNSIPQETTRPRAPVVVMRAAESPIIYMENSSDRGSSNSDRVEGPGESRLLRSLPQCSAFQQLEPKAKSSTVGSMSNQRNHQPQYQQQQQQQQEMPGDTCCSSVSQAETEVTAHTHKNLRAAGQELMKTQQQRIHTRNSTDSSQTASTSRRRYHNMTSNGNNKNSNTTTTTTNENGSINFRRPFSFGMRPRRQKMSVGGPTAD